MVLLVKNSPVNAEDVGDMGSISGQENPLEEGMAAHSSIFAGGSHGQRSVVAYSPQLAMLKRWFCFFF